MSGDIRSKHCCLSTALDMVIHVVQHPASCSGLDHGAGPPDIALEEAEPPIAR